MSLILGMDPGVNTGVAFIFARTETKAFQQWCWKSADAMLFLAGRVRFRLPGGGQSGPAGAPSVLIAYGDNNVRALERCGNVSRGRRQGRG